MTHKERVLQLLSDGQPHSHHELYALHVIGHSRIADLRRDGHEIRQWRDGDDYLYQLVGGGVGVQADGFSAGVADTSPSQSDDVPDGQLKLVQSDTLRPTRRPQWG